MNTQQQRDSPFFRPWTTPGEAPPFEEIRPEHFAPAYARAFAEHEAEVAVIASRAEPTDFTNTIAALELSGRMLARVRCSTFWPALIATKPCLRSSASWRRRLRDTGTISIPNQRFSDALMR